MEGFLPDASDETLLPDVETDIHQRTVTDAAARLAIVDERNPSLDRVVAMHEVEEHRAKDAVALASLEECRAHNSLVPLHRLPLELLMVILTAVKDSQPISEYTDQAYFKPAKYAGVCSLWSDLLLGAHSAAFWTDAVLYCHGVPSSFDLPIHATHAIRLLRSRPLPFNLHLRGASFGDAKPPNDATAAELYPILIPELPRLRTLRIKNLDGFRPLFPLAGDFPHLRSISLDTVQWPTFYRQDVFGDAVFPCLTNVEFIRIGPLNEDEIRLLLGDHRVFENCSRLVLSGFDWRPEIFAQMMRSFPNVAIFEIEHGNFPGKGEEPWLLPPEGTELLVRMLMLRAVKFDHPDNAWLLRMISAPQLETIEIHDEEFWPIDTPLLIVPIERFPALQFLSVESVDTAIFDLESVLSSPCSLRALSFGHQAAPLTAAVIALTEWIRRRPEALDSVPNPSVPQRPEPFVVSLRVLPALLGPDTRQYYVSSELSESERELLDDLKVLGKEWKRWRRRRSRAFGPAFRVRLEGTYPRIQPPLERLASRFPEVFDFVASLTAEELEWLELEHETQA